ncbi:hypothetical protein HDU77_009660 [Chytriomyces hyalinus]|nr:hypothetical protein HDU77_009660 [Chytriomyces hyalinus]
MSSLLWCTNVVEGGTAEAWDGGGSIRRFRLFDTLQRSITNTSKGIIPATASARQGVAKVKTAVKEAKAAVKKAQSDADQANKRLNRWMTANPDKFEGPVFNALNLALKDARHYHQALSGADPNKALLSGSIQSIASMKVDVCWKDKVPPEYSLNKGSLYFVN